MHWKIFFFFKEEIFYAVYTHQHLQSQKEDQWHFSYLSLTFSALQEDKPMETGHLFLLPLIKKDTDSSGTEVSILSLVTAQVLCSIWV